MSTKDDSVTREQPDKLIELEAVLEAMADGVFVVDTERIVRRWNHAMMHMTGYTAEETIGTACGVFSWLEENAEDGLYCKLFAAGSMDRSELTVRCKDGSTLPVLISSRTLSGPRGEPTGAVVTVTDISTLKRLESEVAQLRDQVEERYQFHNIVGKSHAMRQVFDLTRSAAESDTTVLIHGETGTGKELVAKAIHFQSARKNGPLVSVNCSSLSENLVESELFGHVRGAFTGATKDNPGRFERANGGTIFLDEIGEIPLPVQVKLLRVIQEREIERVGESTARKVDVRIVAATHRDLRESARHGSFREDLFYRLNVFPIHLPPLRERKEDIEPLVAHFIDKYNTTSGKHIAGMNPDAMRMIMDYCWPGNVRELENAVQHAFVTCRKKEIEALDLPLELRRTDIQNRICDAIPKPAHAPRAATQPRQPATKEAIESALTECGWNKAAVARKLGITRTQVWRRMVQLGIPLNPDEPPLH